MNEPLVTALLDLLAPEIERMVDERLTQRLSAYEAARRPSEWMTTSEAAAYLRLTPSALRRVSAAAPSAATATTRAGCSAARNWTRDSRLR